MKCKTCGAPAKHMPPDGDFRYDPPRSTLPREGQGEVVAYQYRYKHNNPGAIWSSWGPPDPALESDTDFESERRPLYTAPSPAVRDGDDDVRQLLMAIENAARMSERGILSADGGQAATEIRALVPLKFRRALSTQEQGNG